MSTLADAQTASALIPAQVTAVANVLAEVLTASAVAIAYAPAGGNEPMTGAEQRAILDLVTDLGSRFQAASDALDAIIVQTDAIEAMS